MTYAELSEVQARRSMQFAEAQTNAMSMYCNAERDLKDSQAENDRLRELVRDMWRELAVACAEQVTSHETLRKVSDRMRKLGVDE